MWTGVLGWGGDQLQPGVGENVNQVPPGRAGTRLLLVAAILLSALWVAVALHAYLSWSEAPLAPVAGAGLVLTGALAAVVHRYQRRLQAVVATDPLTGLANHRGFHNALEASLRRAKRAGRPLALAILDLDNFKAVNDRHGHARGDEALVEIAAKVRCCVREADLAARIGGEEFGLILPDTGIELAGTVVECVRTAIGEVEVEGRTLSCSAGIAVFPDIANDAVSLLRFADDAMYSAKHRGKDRVLRYDPERTRIEWTDAQRKEIRALIERPGAIVSAYQPVMSLAGATLVGYEGLARFPELADRPVSRVFAQAHGCDLGPELEAAAVAAALAADNRPPGTHLAINISPSALDSEPMRRALPHDLSGLVIELTEHELFSEEKELDTRISGLRARGARIAIDDTGAGYAGLSQLMRIRPDIVKLDRELTEGIRSDPARMTLVDAFVRFARGVGAIVCAEGIETTEDLTVLADLDVEWGQGYVIGQPTDPWSEVSDASVAACREALATALVPEGVSISPGDRGLERLSRRLAEARSKADLEQTLALIAGELNADDICLSAFQRGRGRLETLAQITPDLGETVFDVADFPVTSKVLAEQRPIQVLAGDRDAEEREVDLLLGLGYSSLLMVPVVHRGESVGLIEAYREREQAWTRLEISRARIVSNQFASTIEALFHGEDAVDRMLLRRA